MAKEIPDFNEMSILLIKWVSRNENEVTSITGLKVMVAQLLSTDDLEVTRENIIEHLKK